MSPISECARECTQRSHCSTLVGVKFHFQNKNLRTGLHIEVERFLQNGVFCTKIDKEFYVALADANSDLLAHTRRVGKHNADTTGVQ